MMRKIAVAIVVAVEMNVVSVVSSRKTSHL